MWSCERDSYTYARRQGGVACDVSGVNEDLMIETEEVG